MKGFTFHAEMPKDRKSKSASKDYPFQPWTRATLRRYADNGQHVNVIAVSTDRDSWRVENGKLIIECVAGVFAHENSPVSLTCVAYDYLRERTTRIDEATARRLHPALFASLDYKTE